VAFSQSWPGYETGRYSGISSANSRPGGMTYSPYKFDATLIGMHFFTRAKNLYENEDAFDMISSGGFKGLKGFTELSSTKSFVYANLQGPSFLYNVKNKWTLAFSWNTRFLWSSRFSEPQIGKLFDRNASSLNMSGIGETAVVLFNSWNEFGIGGSGMVWKKSKHSISAGGFFKLVYGGGNLNFNLDNMEIETEGNTVKKMSFSLTANISEQTYYLLDEGEFDLFDRAGYGFDIGAEYRFRDTEKIKDVTDYKVSAGFALNDIGQMRYRSATKYNQVNVSAENISLDRFRSAPTFRAAIDTLGEIFDVDKERAENYSVTLPMSFKLYADVNLGKHFYIYNELQTLFAKLTNAQAGTLIRYNITPRFEDKRFGVYLPIAFTNYVPANAGLALRWKPLIIGSGNLFTFWAYDDMGKAFDIYLIIKIPILNKERVKLKKEPVINPATSF